MKMKILFELFDLEKNGKISKDEFLKMLLNYPLKDL